LTWFKVDDTAHSHPKLLRAGNAAIGLWLRAGSYAAQHLTEGTVPGVVVQLYGTTPQAAKLVKAGLWHDAGHTCSRCPQPATGDYVMHDYLIYNPTRAQEESKRRAAAERQARGRERQRAERENAAESSAKTNRSEVFSSQKRSESAPEKDAFQDGPAGQDVLSQRDDTGASRWSRPGPSRTASPYGEAAPPTGSSSGLPDPLADLKRGIAAAGLAGIAWDLKASAWEYTRQALDRVGVPAMVAFAVNSSRLKGAPAGASAWVGGWRSLEPAPAAEPGGEVAYLPAAAGAAPVLPFAGPLTRQQRDQAATDELFGAAMERAHLRMQQEGTAG
jgi:hypothetical protein